MLSGLQRGAVSLDLGYRFDGLSTSCALFFVLYLFRFLVTSQFTHIFFSLVLYKISGGL